MSGLLVGRVEVRGPGYRAMSILEAWSTEEFAGICRIRGAISAEINRVLRRLAQSSNSVNARN